MKSLADRIARLEARAAGERSEPDPTDEAIERLRQHFNDLPMKRARESHATACMSTAQALASVKREIDFDMELAKVYEREGRVDLARSARLTPHFLKFRRRELEAAWGETRGDHIATGTPAREREET